ncbi:MAG: hypothetical protein M0R50_10550 [Candidatus Cloacimonetes bacterium]|jgi:hypothetical protein|nr:hypothetical protein [Candidatus Cloacimonadota bacterium]
MIKLLHNIAKGATIAVVGSGPTATDFIHSKNDISIGVNGAAKLGQKFDYFMCGDTRSSCFDWFNIDCSRVRVIAKLTAAPDKILYPIELFPDIKRIAVITAKQNTIKLPRPVEPHLTFMYKWYRQERLKEDMNYLMFGGTISCCAVQLAYVMGASKIVLYGCNFTSVGRHYFYQTRKPGSISDSQRTVMNTVINEIKKRGVKFEIVGSTTLGNI